MPSNSMLDVRVDFPFLDRTIGGKPIAYLDNAATTQKPRRMIERILDLYRLGMANVHRAANPLADEVTEAFESARAAIARFIGAQPREIIFVGSATDGINLVCRSLSRTRRLKVLTTTQEHHSNFLPWAEYHSVDFMPWFEDGRIDLSGFARKLGGRPDLVSVARTSNFLGALHPIREIAARSHDAGVPVMADASQSIAHEPHDVNDLQCDYMVFSGHKIYGPGGIGVLYARDGFIDRLSPDRLGGSMVKEVHAESWVPNDIPHRFEAGTPHIEGVVGLAASLEYLEALGWEHVRAHECSLVQYAKRGLAAIRGVRCFGPPPGEPCAPLVSFHVEGIESAAVERALANRANVIVRSGFLCAQPAHDEIGTGPSVRASFAVYNTVEEVDRLVETVECLSRCL